MSKKNSSLSPVAKGAGPASAATATGPVTPAGTACCGYASLKEQSQSMLRAMGVPVSLIYPLADLAMRLQLGAWMEQISPEDATARLESTPIFILHGTNDTEVSVNQARKLYSRARSSKELWIVPGAGHCIIDDPKNVAGTQHGEYVRRILNFLRQHMTA